MQHRASAAISPNKPRVSNAQWQLHGAIYFQDHHRVQRLLSEGFLVDRNVSGQTGRSALGLAIDTTDLDLVRAVLRMGGSVNSPHLLDGEPLAVPSLVLALKSHRLMIGYIAKLILHERTPAGVQRQSGKLVAELLRTYLRLAKKKKTIDENGETKVESSHQGGEVFYQDVRDIFDDRISATVRLLIDHGAKVNEVDGTGETPLIHAARLGFLGAVKVLKEKGADVCRTNWWGMTAMMIATTQRFVNVMDVLKKPTHDCEHLVIVEQEQVGGRVDAVLSVGDGEAEEMGKTRYQARSAETSRTVKIMYGDNPMLNRTYVDTVLVRRLPMVVRSRLKKSNNELWDKHRIVRDFGTVQAEVSSIPYGSVNTSHISLAEYINNILPQQQLENHANDEDDGKHGNTNFRLPVYWFIPLRIDNPLHAEMRQQLAKSPSFLYHSPQPPRGHRSSDIDRHAIGPGYVARTHQFFYGSAGTGAPHHVHGPSWNFLARGRKKWWFWAPGRSSYSKKASLDSVHEWESDADLWCIQEEGDVVLVPEDWGHSTFALEESIGVAVEYDHWGVGAHWTLFSPPPFFARNGPGVIGIDGR